MIGTEPYATIDELKARLDIVDTDHDTVLTAVINAASRMVDGWCHRQFGNVTESRIVTAELPDRVFLDDDLVSFTLLETDTEDDGMFATSWDAADIVLGPQDGPPYRIVYATGDDTFPTCFRGVRITGTWGYSDTVPTAIIEATLLQAARLYKRKDAPFGIAGSAELGTLQVIGQVDPDVKQLLMPYTRQGWVI